VEWQGHRNGWSYQLRAAVAYSHSRTADTDYFPNNATLQQQAEIRAQTNAESAVFTGGRSSGLSFAASARAEHSLTEYLVIGSQFSMDRSDYYHPVELSVYLRHVFGGSTTVAEPPKPLRPYND